MSQTTTPQNVENTATGLPSTGTSHSTSISSGVFFRFHCRHEQLFRKEYKRSNRNQGMKIIRCFPHCCPNHVDRSYCGSSLELALDFQHPDLIHQQPSTIHVFARFEPLLPDSMAFQIGEYTSRRELQAQSQGEMNIEASWVEGILRDPSTLDNIHTIENTSSCIISLNGQTTSKWFYHWESGANKSRRLTKHVLRAYVFGQVPETNPDRMQFISTIISTPFTMVSYRRAAWEHPEIHPEETPNITLQQMVRYQVERAFEEFQAPRHTKQEILCLQCQDVIRDEYSMRDVAIIYYFLSHCTMENEMKQSSRLREQMYQHVKGWYPCSRLWTILFPSINENSNFVFEETLILLIHIALWSLNRPNLESIQSFFNQHCMVILDRQMMQQAFYHSILMMKTHLEMYLKEIGTTMSLYELSESIISMVHHYPQYQPLWKGIRGLLEHPQMVLWPPFVAQMREVYMRKYPPPSHSHHVVSIGRLQGNWIVNDDSFIISSTQFPSIWTLFLGWIQLVEITIQINDFHTFQIQTPYSLLPGSNTWMNLICDGQPHLVSVLPIGLSTLWGLETFGGDYLATLSTTQLYVEFYWWPQSVRYRGQGSLQHATRVCLTLKQPMNSLVLHAHIDIQTSSTILVQDIETWTPRQRISLVLEWQTIFNGEMTYHRQE